MSRSSSSALLPFFFFSGEGSPTKVDYRRKSGTLILTSLLEDLVYVYTHSTFQATPEPRATALRMGYGPDEAASPPTNSGRPIASRSGILGSGAVNRDMEVPKQCHGRFFVRVMETMSSAIHKEGSLAEKFGAKTVFIENHLVACHLDTHNGFPTRTDLLD